MSNMIINIYIYICWFLSCYFKWAVRPKPHWSSSASCAVWCRGHLQVLVLLVQELSSTFEQKATFKVTVMNSSPWKSSSQWLVGGWALPLWKMMEWKSVGMMTFPIYWKKNMFQTTNQMMFVALAVVLVHKKLVGHKEILGPSAAPPAAASAAEGCWTWADGNCSEQW